METIGIDLGNYADKSSTGICYVARTMKIPNLNQIGANDIAVEQDGQFYCMGKGEFDNEIDKSLKKYLLPRIGALVGLSTETSEIRLALGLPINYYEGNVEQIIEKIKNNRHFNVKINKDGKIKTRVFSIKELKVLPECLSAFSMLPKEVVMDIKQNGRNIYMVDIGGLTVDICVLTCEGTVLHYETHELGTKVLYNNILNKVKNIAPRLRFTIDKVNEDFVKALIDNPEYKDAFGNSYIFDFVEEELMEYVYSLKNLFIDYQDFANCNFILSGGGGLLTREAFVEASIAPYYVQEDRFANAKGYKYDAETFGGCINLEELEGEE